MSLYSSEYAMLLMKTLATESIQSAFISVAAIDIILSFANIHGRRENVNTFMRRFFYKEQSAKSQ